MKVRNKHYLIGGKVPTLNECVSLMKNLVNYKISTHERHCCYNTIRLMFFMDGEYRWKVLRAYHRIYTSSDAETRERIRKILERVHLSYIEAVETFERQYGKPKQITLNDLIQSGDL